MVATMRAGEWLPHTSSALYARQSAVSLIQIKFRIRCRPGAEARSGQFIFLCPTWFRGGLG